ncbi:hypothetical protein [Rhizobium sp. BK376]|uniref:hypothetical protein n=1 Tax=Rhizobium sp. BK376 TaxID=2512149 RepID=UPI0010507A83|nr:hypothetical protein [Rhizobium sp. BK376]TCR80793.1 hypothetical protein EV561_11370 [Rhizobium sp. BK376]
MTLRKHIENAQNQNDREAETSVRYCGIVMPIASMSAEYDASHWKRVKDVLDSAIISAGYTPRLVSDSDEIGVIHARIVQNLYDDEIVVCDVSNKNPNCMFELGLRLAFDKPTIVVKDELTAYTFDAGVIEHIPYRHDQRFDDVEAFKERLTRAITMTVAKKEKDPSFSPFLKHFGTFTPKQVENHELPQAEYLTKRLDTIEHSLSMIASLSVSSAREFRSSRINYRQEISNLIRIWMEIRKIAKSDAAMAKDDCYKYIYEKFNGIMSPPNFETQFDDAWGQEIGIFG